MEPDVNNVMDAPRRYIETSRSVTSSGTLVTTTTTTTERMKDQKMESRYNGPYHPDNLPLLIFRFVMMMMFCVGSG